jgi:hypothetical protein
MELFPVEYLPWKVLTVFPKKWKYEQFTDYLHGDENLGPDPGGDYLAEQRDSHGD